MVQKEVDVETIQDASYAPQAPGAWKEGMPVPLSAPQHGSSWLSPTATLLTWPLCFNPLSWYFFKVALGHAGFLLDIWKTETITKRKIELSGDLS